MWRMQEGKCGGRNQIRIPHTILGEKLVVTELGWQLWSNIKPSDLIYLHK